MLKHDNTLTLAALVWSVSISLRDRLCWSLFRGSFQPQVRMSIRWGVAETETDFVNKPYVSAWEWKSEAEFSSDGIYVQQCTHIWFQNVGPGFMKRPNGTLMCRRCPGGGCSQQRCMSLMKTNRFDGPNQDYPLINTTFSRFLANLCWITATFQPSFLRLESRALKTERMQDFRYSRPSLLAQPWWSRGKEGLMCLIKY